MPARVYVEGEVSREIVRSTTRFDDLLPEGGLTGESGPP
jgi:hypothetical protein